MPNEPQQIEPWGRKGEKEAGKGFAAAVTDYGKASIRHPPVMACGIGAFRESYRRSKSEYNSLCDKAVLSNTRMQGTGERFRENTIMLDGASQKWDK